MITYMEQSSSTERSVFYLNEVSFCKDNFRCNPKRTPMKDRMKIAACSLAGDMWFRYQNCKVPNKKGVMNFYDLMSNFIRSTEDPLFSLGVTLVGQKYCELKCNPIPSDTSPPRESCVEECMNNNQEFSGNLMDNYRFV